MASRHQTAGRPGARPEKVAARAPEGTRVYAIGDIHGRADLLGRLHREILDDAADAGDIRKVAVYIGDYVDRGPDSFGVVEMLIEEPLHGFERHHLKGNHEDFLLRFLESGSHGEVWMMNGARATLESYGVEWSDLAYGADGLATARRKFADFMPESHLRFFHGLELRHREGDYLFVHAGIRPGVPLAEQRPFDLMWIREAFLESEADHGCVVVHGHTIETEPQVRPNRIGIDTGAFHTGRLTALVVEGAERRFLAT
jgi:serine/threonine protein phosphatase 1